MGTAASPDTAILRSEGTIGGYPFVCVPLLYADFSDVDAVYVALSVANDGTWIMLDVGLSGASGERIDSPDRIESWQARCPHGNIWVCVHPMPRHKYSEKNRSAMVAEIRGRYAPPCGE